MSLLCNLPWVVKTSERIISVATKVPKLRLFCIAMRKNLSANLSQCELRLCPRQVKARHPIFLGERFLSQLRISIYPSNKNKERELES